LDVIPSTLKIETARFFVRSISAYKSTRR